MPLSPAQESRSENAQPCGDALTYRLPGRPAATPKNFIFRRQSIV